MPISITCTCGKRFVFEDRYANQQANCDCGNSFTIPQIEKKLRYRNVKIPKYIELLSLLKEELLAYWGYAIISEMDGKKLPDNFVDFSESEQSYIPENIQKPYPYSKIENYQKEWQAIIKEYQDAAEKYRPNKVEKLHPVAQKIGNYCYELKYIFPQSPQLAVFKQAIDHIQNMESAYKLFTFLEKFIQRKFHIRKYYLWIGKIFFAASILTPIIYIFWPVAVGMIFTFSLIYLILKLKLSWKKFQLQQYFHQLWQQNIVNPLTTLTVEHAEIWVKRIFNHPILKPWEYKHTPALLFPEQYRRHFITNSVFSDEIEKFEIRVKEDVEKWYQQIYQVCHTTFQKPGRIQFCFVYLQHLAWLNSFFQQLQNFLQEINKIQGLETFYLIRPHVIPAGSLATIQIGLEPFLKESQYEDDSSWKLICKLFQSFQDAIALCDFTESSHLEKIAPEPQFCEILSLCLYELARRKPMIFVLDRLDYVDMLSLDFLNQISKNSPKHRILFIVSYSKDNLLQNRQLQNVIAHLQNFREWKTPEIVPEMIKLPDILIHKKQVWETLEYTITNCVTLNTSHLIGISGPSGVGKSFLGKRFWQIAGDGQFWFILYRYPEFYVQFPNILEPIKNFLENILEQNILNIEESNSIHNFLKLLSPDTSSFEDGSLENPNISISILPSVSINNFLESGIIFQKIKDIFVMLAKYKPIIIFIDDLHWADSLTLSWLTELAHSPVSASILITFTFNSEQIGKFQNDWPVFLNSIRQEHTTYNEFTVSLPETDEIISYLNQSFSPNLFIESSNSFGIQIANCTSNSPWLLCELLKWLLATKALDFFSGFWTITREVNISNLSPEWLLEEMQSFANKILDGKTSLIDHQSTEIDFFPSENLDGKTSSLDNKVNKEKEFFTNILELAAIAQCPISKDWILQTPSLASHWEKIQTILQFFSSRQILIQSGEQPNTWELTHEYYAKLIRSKISNHKKNQLHRFLARYWEGKNLARCLYHSYQIEDWPKILEISEIIGRHYLVLNDWSSATKVFEIGIQTSVIQKKLGRLAKYYLYKSRALQSFLPKEEKESIVLRKLPSTSYFENHCQNKDLFGQLKDFLNIAKVTPSSNIHSLLAQIQTFSHPQYRIMAQRFLLLFSHPNSANSAIILQQTFQTLQIVANHTLRLQMIQSFFSGELESLEQHNWEELSNHLSLDQQKKLFDVILDVLSYTPALSEKSKCLYKIAEYLPKVYQYDLLEEGIKKLDDGLVHTSTPLDQGLGLLILAKGISEYDVHLAWKYLHQGLEVLIEFGTIGDHPDIANALIQGLSFVPKLPNDIANILVDQLLTVAKNLNTEYHDRVFCEAALQLFGQDNMRAIAIATQIYSIQMRQNWIRLAIDKYCQESTEPLENAVITQSEIFGILFAQEIADNDLGIARRFLRRLPDSFDTQMVTIQLCGIPGKRIQTILKLAKFRLSDPVSLENMQRIIVKLLEHGEIDIVGEQEILEKISDSNFLKVELLLHIVVNLHEVSPKETLEFLERFLHLLAKYSYEGKKSELKDFIYKIENRLQKLQTSFLLTYWNSWLPWLESIPDIDLRIKIFQIFAHNLISSPQEISKILQHLSPELRTKVQESEDSPELPSITVKLDTQDLEGLTSLRAIRQKDYALGQKVHQMLYDQIVHRSHPLEKINAWISVLSANSSGETIFSQWVISKIWELEEKLPAPDLSFYYDLIYCISGISTVVRNDLISQVISHLVTYYSNNHHLLDIYHSAWDRCQAKNILQGLVSFGSSYCHQFILGLLNKKHNDYPIETCIFALRDFFEQIQGVFPERELQWIKQAISNLENRYERLAFVELQEDSVLLQSIGIIQLLDFIADPLENLRICQHLLQKIFYLETRNRLQSFIIWKVCDQVDKILFDMREPPELMSILEKYRVDAAYFLLQEFEQQTHLPYLMQRKKIWQEIVSNVIKFIETNKSLTTTWVVSESDPGENYGPLQSGVEKILQRMLTNQYEIELHQVFFVISEICCQLNLDNLDSFDIPWLHRMVWIASQINPEKMSNVGIDLLQIDEWECLNLWVQKIARLYPKISSIFLASIFRVGKCQEIPLDFGQEKMTLTFLKKLLPSFNNPFLLEKRDYILKNLAIELVSDDFQSAILFASFIENIEENSKTIVKLATKRLASFPKELENICQNTLYHLRSLPWTYSEIWQKVAVIVYRQYPFETIRVLQNLDVSDQQQCLLQILKVYSKDTLSWIAKITKPELQAMALNLVLTKLPVESSERIIILQEIWEMSKNIQLPFAFLELSKNILRRGIREIECRECNNVVSQIILEMWQYSQKYPKAAWQIISTSFPLWSKLVSSGTVMNLFHTLFANCEATLKKEVTNS